MKKTRAISLLLSLSLICAMLVPGAAAFAENESGSDSGMVISKTATANDSGSYTITLEAYATGSKIISEVTEDIPTDIVLVLDQSGSMADCLVCGKEINQGSTHNIYTETTSIDTRSSYYIKNDNRYTSVSYCDGNHEFLWESWQCTGGAGWYTSDWSNDHTDSNKITPKTDTNPNGTQFYESKREACSSRLSALKTTLTNFAAAVNQKAAGTDGILGTADDVNHRIAVVGYASRADSNNPWINTEVFIGANQYNYNVNAKSYYGSAFQSMNTAQGQKNVAASIGELDANGATYTNYGLEMANGILDANPVQDGKKRNRVIILFSDGYPGKNADDFNQTAADDALEEATAAKNAGVSLYAVGIFSGADATSSGNKNGTNTEAANWFMQNLSSNNGKVQTPSYYLSAGDASTLNSIFQQISDQIETGGSSTTLSSETVIKDIIAPAFTLPANATADNITLETYQCTGKNSNNEYTWSKNETAMDAEATVNGDQVSVTGFDFAEHYVGTVTEGNNVTYRGHKLVISFTVKPRPGFLGGNNVYTNAGAGVYENSSATDPVLTFPQPQVNVPIQDVAVTAAEKNVYLLGGLTADELKSGATVKVGGVALDLSKASDTTKPWGLEPWQTEYVDITVTVKDKDGNAIPADGLIDLTADTTYTISVTVAPITNGDGAKGTANSMDGKTGSANASINVFKPELTFKDSEVYYGADAPANADYKTNNLTDTKWAHKKQDNSVTYSTAVTMIGTAPELDLTYTPEGGKVNTKQDIAVDVAVKINGTDVTNYTTFNHTDCAGKTCTVPEGKEFLLHVKTCQLTITKEGGTDGEPYVFTVCKDGAEYTEATIVGNSSVTIYELPVGPYTIEEDTGWSWRFTPTIGGGVTLSKDNASNTITCTNTKANDYWLNGFSTVVKNIFGISH